jgi:hypothetical protein
MQVKDRTEDLKPFGSLCVHFAFEKHASLKQQAASPLRGNFMKHKPVATLPLSKY